mgnify:FL=1
MLRKYIIFLRLNFFGNFLQLVTFEKKISIRKKIGNKDFFQ